MPANSVTVRVPASTSNLGPGFDTFGIALRLHNRVRLTPTASRHLEPVLTSPIDEAARPGATRLVASAAAAFFKATRRKAFPFEVHLSGEVPIARGLGSSVTVRLGVIAALNALSGAGLSRQALFEMVADLEGHPDNAAPAAFGGFTASAMIDGRARCLRFAVSPAFHFVTLVPPFEVSTEKARKLLPAAYSRADVVHNLTRVSLITAAFARRDADALRGLFDDRVHQPYREPLLPQLNAVIRAGERAGAVGGWLSGSGSTIICLTREHPERVADAMSRQLRGSKVHLLRADTGGFRVTG